MQKHYMTSLTVAITQKFLYQVEAAELNRQKLRGNVTENIFPDFTVVHCYGAKLENHHQWWVNKVDEDRVSQTGPTAGLLPCLPSSPQQNTTMFQG